jgi:hypothetical protein
MTKPKWPVYRAHSEARCFRCDGELDDCKADDFVPRGDGACHGWCASCEVFTWYDLLDETEG